eukprot:scaffold75924_cov63-Phaeocystis_antarctica.AAC.2
MGRLTRKTQSTRGSQPSLACRCVPEGELAGILGTAGSPHVAPRRLGTRGTLRWPPRSRAARRKPRKANLRNIYGLNKGPVGSRSRPITSLRSLPKGAGRPTMLLYFEWARAAR